eukprot:356142-Chlamydomonas_euryale.AAC.1
MPFMAPPPHILTLHSLPPTLAVSRLQGRDRRLQASTDALHGPSSTHSHTPFLTPYTRGQSFPGTRQAP